MCDEGAAWADREKGGGMRKLKPFDEGDGKESHVCVSV